MVSIYTHTNDLVQLRSEKLTELSGYNTQLKEAERIELLLQGYQDHCRIVKRLRDVEARLAVLRTMEAQHAESVASSCKNLG